MSGLAVSGLAVSGLAVVIRLEVIRFACRGAGCPRVTFAGQIDGLTTAHSRYGFLR